MALEVGSIVEGKVSGITPFGAFIDLPGGQTGLVHISEVARDYVKDIKDHLSENQQVKVKILSLEKNGKISLSIKRAVAAEPRRPRPSSPDGFVWQQRPAPQTEMSFEDKMQLFKKTSDERMQTLRRNTEGRRGRKGSK